MAIARAIQKENSKVAKVAIYRDGDIYPTIVDGILVGYTPTEVLVRNAKGNGVKVYNERLQITKIVNG